MKSLLGTLGKGSQALKERHLSNEEREQAVVLLNRIHPDKRYKIDGHIVESSRLVDLYLSDREVIESLAFYSMGHKDDRKIDEFLSQIESEFDLNWIKDLTKNKGR